MTGSDIGFDDIQTSTGSGVLGTLEYLGLHALLASPAAATDDGGGVYDLAGWTLTMDEGILFITAPPGGVGFDFSAFVPLPMDVTALSTLDLSGPLATWQIPLDAGVTFMAGGQIYTFQVSGTLSLTEVPEPGTLLLVAAGLAWFATRSRAAAV